MSRPLLRSLRPLSGPSTTTLAHSRPRSTLPEWPTKSHLRAAPTVPLPVPALYPHKIVLSDGSTFTAHLTNPSPSIIRLTRDVTNNPLWAPGTERRGLGDGEAEGRVGRFRRRFEGVAGADGEADGSASASASASADAAAAAGTPQAPPRRAFAEQDFDWMSEGAVEEKVVQKEAPKASEKGKKK